MEQASTIYSYLRSEFFEKLIPKMVYHGNKKERHRFFQQLRDNGRNFIYYLFNMVYADELPSYPYEKENFILNIINRDNVSMIQLLLPAYNPNADDIFKIYLVFDKNNNDIADIRYFVAKRFSSGQSFIIYISPQLKELPLEELNSSGGNMEYEYQALVKNYYIILENERKSDIYPKNGKTEQNQYASDKWSRDWSSFNLKETVARLDKAEMQLKQNQISSDSIDIGITKGEFLEYIHWLHENDSKDLLRLTLFVLLKEAGVSHEKAVIETFSPGALERLCQIIAG